MEKVKKSELLQEAQKREAELRREIAELKQQLQIDIGS